MDDVVGVGSDPVTPRALTMPVAALQRQLLESADTAAFPSQIEQATGRIKADRHDGSVASDPPGGV
ncbi:MAG: hypothetical protein ACP5P1_14615, partial [Acidimicrobiales bacterium]